MILIRKLASMVEISPCGQIRELLQHQLTQRRRVREGGKFTTSLEPLYSYVPEKDMIRTFAGFIPRLCGFFSRISQPYEAVEPKPVMRKKPNLQLLADFPLRGGQLRMLASMLTFERGQYNGFTAMGKSHLIRAYVLAHPDSRIVVMAQQRAVANGLYRELCHLIGDEHIGMVGGGANRLKRVTVVTAKSALKPGPEYLLDVDTLLYDEVHTAGAPDISEKLARYNMCRMFGFSASTECRSDKADLIVEGLFGPVRETVTMQEGREEGYAADVKAYFYRHPARQARAWQEADKKRETIWLNESRNNLIARIARHWETQMANPQILIMVDTLEHACALGCLLHDYQVVYATADKQKVERMRKHGRLPPQFVMYTDRERRLVDIAIECGEAKRVISTTTLGTGVDMRSLDVFIRADGGSSEISNVQYRGRVARGKHGFYLDIYDFGDGDSYRDDEDNVGPRERAAKKRYSSCLREGWEPELLNF